MKNRKSFLHSLFALCIIGLMYSCEQQPINPSLILDDVFIPEGFSQIEDTSMNVQSRLEEFRIDNPDDEYYYLKYSNGALGKRSEWMFPQKELLIEVLVANNNDTPGERPEFHGIIVKKIKGDWRKEEFKYIDTQPIPMRGIKQFYSFISENMKYPTEAKKAGVEGKVFVEFVVDKNGKLTEVKTIKGIGHGCDKEAERVLKAAPKWTPGNVVDMNVAVRMILPINFKLE